MTALQMDEAPPRYELQPHDGKQRAEQARMAPYYHEHTAIYWQ